jgi:hypothetical protein
MAALAMTTTQEHTFLEQYAQTTYAGYGEIVDLGCWLGATTVSLAKGLAKNSNPRAVDRQIHAYDRFIWEEWMDSYTNFSELKQRYRPQDSFLREFKERSAYWSRHICIHAGDICELGWSAGEIEFVFVDVMKSWSLANHVVRHFFSSLIPEVSVVVHQDFAHYYTSWIHLLNYRFRDYFEVLYDIPQSSSVVFKNIASIPEEMLNTTYGFESFTEAEIDSAFRYSAHLTSPEKHANIAAAKVMLFLHLGNSERAKRELSNYLSQNISIHSELSIVQAMLGASQR